MKEAILLNVPVDLRIFVFAVGSYLLWILGRMKQGGIIAI